MKKLFTLFQMALLCLVVTVNAQNSLTVINPDAGFWANEYSADINAADFIIKPQGAYTEVGMVLTISSSEVEHWGDFWLEAILNFTLPEGSIVTDSWLWMLDDSTIVKADILEYYEALANYEEVVDRNTDPSLLYRKPDGGYQLRVYPLPANGSRKVKVTFLIPTQWTKEKVITSLPMHILQTSALQLSHFRIITFPDTNWQNPRITLYPNSVFVSEPDPVYGSLLTMTVPLNNVYPNINFSMDSPLIDDQVFVSILDDTSLDKFYQVVYFPEEFEITPKVEKVLFLVDHDSNSTSFSFEEILDYIQQYIDENMEDQDLFGLMYTDISGVVQSTTSWKNKLEAEVFFSTLPDTIDENPHVVDLLNTGLDFLALDIDSADVILCTSSTNFDSSMAEDQSQIIASNAGFDLANINILNYQTDQFFWVNPEPMIYYLSYQHWQLYENITSMSEGQLIDYSQYSTPPNIEQSLSLFYEPEEFDYSVFDFEFNLNFDSGFSILEYTHPYSSQDFFDNKPIVQVGRYIGQIPLTAEFNAITDDGFINHTKSIDVLDVHLSDSLGREVWYGNYIFDLESEVSSQQDIEEIIEISIEERVLSNYTAFLALDLENGAEPCIACWNYTPGGGSTSTENIHDLGAEIKISPNPFSDFCTVEIDLPDDLILDDLEVQIINAVGQIVDVLDASSLINQGQLNLTWHGLDQRGNALPSGVYFLQLRSGKITQTHKLVIGR